MLEDIILDGAENIKKSEEMIKKRQDLRRIPESTFEKIWSQCLVERDLNPVLSYASESTKEVSTRVDFLINILKQRM